MAKANKTDKGRNKADPANKVVAKAHEFREFFDESRAEMKKVTYPSRRETVTTCIAVVVLVIVVSIFLGVVDLGLSKLVELILS